MSKDKKILIIIIVNLVIIISEVSFGLISNSFALIADALHNTGDVLAVIVTYIALRLGSKSTTFKQTFGYVRAEMMAAFVNTIFLYGTMLYMIYEAINRFFNPEIISPIYMIIVGIIAVIANGISAYILNSLGVEACGHNHSHEHSTHHAHEHSHNHTHSDQSNNEDANIKSAYLHMLSDALISVAVVIAGIFIYFFKIYYIDSILTVVFSVYILYHSYPLLKKSFLSLMDINIIEVSQEQLESVIKEDENIISYSDLHIYKPSSKHNFISLEIVLKDDLLNLVEIENITSILEKKLNKLNFDHVQIQVASKKNEKSYTNCLM
ncbi:cation diffusion facilitator family transporter [Poseidonibacter antarcticus]|uniref:cation diffusion facilitator family transporter n=1 Tax=Poseidonibacter antarcticus TaxID=2478538 RepID=UPI000EF4AAE1|nr:cation diffusion facilitator family transporter [Poseidonibacter antarcticus]